MALGKLNESVADNQYHGALTVVKMIPTLPTSFSARAFHFSSPVRSTYSLMHLLIRVFFPISTTLCSRRPYNRFPAASKAVPGCDSCELVCIQGSLHFAFRAERGDTDPTNVLKLLRANIVGSHNESTVILVQEGA